MELAEFYRYLVDALERTGIPYRIVGSMASIAYGEPRYTNDIDVIVRLDLNQVDALCAAFPAVNWLLPAHFALGRAHDFSQHRQRPHLQHADRARRGFHSLRDFFRTHALEDS